MSAAGKSLQSRVLDLLRREADMDGIVIVSGTEIGLELGVSQSSASAALRALADEKVLQIEGRIRFDIPVVRLLDGAA